MDFILPAWLSDSGRAALRYLPVVVLFIWCLWAVNWRKTWPILAEGGWVPLVLIGVMAAVVWTLVFPSNVIVLGFIPMANGLWQLGAVALLIGLVLSCGWLQTRNAWYPPDISLEPPPPAPLHGQGHDNHAPAVTISHPTH
ncbi:MAG TPA: hypothetical protein VGF55_11490 [Gemmataceae bacterium]|jgi:hypothetical protein